MLSKEYVIWAGMLALLIISAVSIAITLSILFFHVIGVATVGLNMALPFLFAWLVIILYPINWFINGA